MKRLLLLCALLLAGCQSPEQRRIGELSRLLNVTTGEPFLP